MKSSRARHLAFACLIFFPPISSARAQVAIKSPEKDVLGSKDSALLSRIEGSYIAYFKLAFDELKIGLERVSFDYDQQRMNAFRSRTVKGEHTTFIYVLPRRVSTSEAISAYERELRRHGEIEILFQGSAKEKELDDGYDRFASQIYAMESDDPGTSFMQRGRDARYFAARLIRPKGDVYMTVFASVNAEGHGEKIVPKDRVGVRVDLVEPKSRPGIDQ